GKSSGEPRCGGRGRVAESNRLRLGGQSVERFAAQADQYLAELGRDLQAGRYQPEALKRVEIPKGDGKTRPWQVFRRSRTGLFRRRLSSSDRTDLRSAIHGNRLRIQTGKRLQGRVEEPGREPEGRVHLRGADADLQGYFDSIPHDRLMDRVEGLPKATVCDWTASIAGTDGFWIYCVVGWTKTFSTGWNGADADARYAARGCY
ncbi:MAG: hypothetical protein ACRER2_14980, partial [Methylococcales bacterium]